MDVKKITSLIQANDYDHYALRVHRGSDAIVGQTLGKSHVWIDGECTDELLSGISALKVDAQSVEKTITRLKQTYAWGNEPIALVGGYYSEHGEDPGEIIIVDNICLAVFDI